MPSPSALSTQMDAVRDHLTREGRDVVDLKADRGWLERVTPSPRLLMSRMAQAQQAHRIQRGRYLVNTVDDIPSAMPLLDALEPLADALLARLNMPYYLSWHTALFYYGLLEQQSSVVYCAVPARKRDADFFGFGVRFVTLKRERFYGIEPAPGFGEPVRIASPEKALLDSLERPALAAPYAVVLAAFADAATQRLIAPERLVAYALETGKAALVRRVGFLMDLNAMPGSDDLLAGIGARTLEPLEPGGSRTEGDIDHKWRLRVRSSLLMTSQQLK